jgi:hypothetical protein
MDELGNYLREPFTAALFAAAMVIIYIHIKARMNNTGPSKTSDFVKPAILVGALVYFVVQNGMGSREPIMTDTY